MIQASSKTKDWACRFLFGLVSAATYLKDWDSRAISGKIGANVSKSDNPT